MKASVFWKRECRRESMASSLNESPEIRSDFSVPYPAGISSFIAITCPPWWRSGAAAGNPVVPDYTAPCLRCLCHLPIRIVPGTDQPSRLPCSAICNREETTLPATPLQGRYPGSGKSAREGNQAGSCRSLSSAGSARSTTILIGKPPKSVRNTEYGSRLPGKHS